MTEESDKIFKLAFALSGAISAGAYTAGVLDFFFQALEAWEKERKQTGTPQHKVVVQVITGASAGAITGAIGTIALARGMRPQSLSAEEKKGAYVATNGPTQDVRCILPSLYSTWVSRPRMVDPRGGVDLLSAQDIADEKAPVASLLNAALLDDIKKEALLPPADASSPPATMPAYPFIAANLHVYMTVSNLRGIPFTLKFGNSTYGMQTHGDRVHYIVTDLGSGPSADNSWLKNDSGTHLTIKGLPAAGLDVPTDWDRYGTAALASSAFPVGLAPRELYAELADYTKRSIPIDKGEGALAPVFPEAWCKTVGSGSFKFLNVDGGVVNNNPFDYAQYAVMDDPNSILTNAQESERAVIMVSPFPEPPAFLPDDAPPAELVAVLKALFPALIDQARFKPAELIPALNPSDFSRFLIAPDRNIGGVEQQYKIACGLLGGFGGFLDEKFRAHDYQLGRRNCQEFLRSIFGLGTSNAIVAPSSGRTAVTLNRNDNETDRPDQYAIVPLVGDALPEVPLPGWPQISQGDFETLMKRIKGRLDAIAPRFARAQTSSRIFRALGRFGLWAGQGRIVEYIRYAILSDLIRRDQIAGWDLPPDIMTGPAVSADEVRQVLAELANPAFSFRTAAGIVKTSHVRPEAVPPILEKLEKVSASAPFKVWKGTVAGQQVYTLQSRSPGGFTALPGIRDVNNWLDEPVIG